MILVYVGALGLIFGSFVNALVWRLSLQLDKNGNPRKKNVKNLSILQGHSMCPHCKHQLAAIDLIPVLSWVLLRGKCRYCRAQISIQYPVVELMTMILFVFSYLLWPYEASTASVIAFSLWLLIITGMVALAIYDIRWKLLPNVLIYPLILLSSFTLATLHFFMIAEVSATELASSIAIASGVFYLLYVLSDGRWIGGGDVKYGLVPGILLANPFKAFFYLFIASLLGSIVVLVGLGSKRLTPKSQVPFGPFLIFSTYILFLLGERIADWYQSYILLASGL